jgi:hypothetical protein
MGAFHISGIKVKDRPTAPMNLRCLSHFENPFFPFWRGMPNLGHPAQPIDFSNHQIVVPSVNPV